MLPDVPMLVAHLAVVEPVFLGETELAHQFERILDERGFEMQTVFGEKRVQLLGSDVPLGLKKGLQDSKSIFEAVDIFLREEDFELLFFLLMALHRLFA
jgi:hypothetical protein